MKAKKKYPVISSLIIALGLVLVPGASGAEKKTAIAIGHIPHFTGAYAATQAGFGPAQEDVIEWANKNNYIPGVELKLVWVDGGTDLSKSMTGFKKMMAEKPKPVVVVGESTAIGTGLKKWHEDAKVPDVEGGFSLSMINPPSWTFCVQTPYPSELGAWLDFYLKNIWKKKESPKFAWLTWDNPYGRAPITKETEAFLKTRGIQAVASEFIPAVPSDTTPHLLRLKELGVDFTFGGMYPSALSVVLKDLEKLGMTGKITIGMTYATNLEELIKYIGPLANDVYVTACHTLTADWPKKCPMVEEMYNKKKRTADRWSYGHAWQMFSIAIEAVRMAAATVGPEKVDGQAVYNALTRLSKFDVWGTGPPVSYSETRRVGMDSVFINVVVNQKSVTKEVVTAPDLLPGGKDVPK